MKYLVLFFALFFQPLHAQVRPAMEVGSEAEYSGWDGLYRLDATSFLSDNSNVVGEVDGTTFTLGHKHQIALFYYNRPHEWRNRFSLNQSFTRDPTLAQFTKATDDLLLESLYLYYFQNPKWLGAFAKASLNTSLLKSYSYQTSTQNFVITNRDGSTQNVSTNKLKLTDALSPLRLKQALGLFAKAFEQSYFQLEVFTGFGFSETIAKDQLILSDDATTASIEATELRNVYELGPDFTALAHGKFYQKLFSYRSQFDLLMPLVNNKPSTETKNALELTQYQWASSLAVNPVAWLSLEYALKLIREPQVVDRVQIANTLNLKIGHDFWKPKHAQTVF